MALYVNSAAGYFHPSYELKPLPIHFSSGAGLCLKFHEEQVWFKFRRVLLETQSATGRSEKWQREHAPRVRYRLFHL